MARKQIYDYVMDVALRNTLKECGFTRKTRRDYIQERPDRVWIFELELAPYPAPGTEFWAAIFFPELDAIMERFAPGFFGLRAPTHNVSHIWAPLTTLIEASTGRKLRPPTTLGVKEQAAERKRLAQHEPAMRYLDMSGWILPDDDMEHGLSDEEFLRRRKRKVHELGLFLDEQWRKRIWPWYWKCEDYGFVVDWVESHQIVGNPGQVSLGVLCHLAGDDRKAAHYFQQRIDAARVPFEDLYQYHFEKHRGSWFRRLWRRHGIWSEEKVLNQAKISQKYLEEFADAARRVASGLGITLDDRARPGLRPRRDRAAAAPRPRRRA